MPTYEYVCTSCSNQWEEIQKISEDPLKVCPKCKNDTARRQISGGNFILKGGGWYADLYSSTPGSKKSDGGSSASSSPSESSTPKTETKAEPAKPSGPSGGGSSSSGSTST